MPNSGDDVLILDEALAISPSVPSLNDTAVLYPETFGRGESTVTQGIDVILLNEQTAQGPGETITLGVLQGDTALYKGDQLSLFIPVQNNSSQAVSYTVDFEEDGSQFASEQQTIPSGASNTYETTRSKSNVGCFTYQANTSNELRVCWMQVRPGPLRAVPESVWLGGSDLSSTLKVNIETPLSESNDQDITVEFFEEGTSIGSETALISPGSEYEFTTSVSKSSEGEFRYVAEITNSNTGISVETNEVVVKWTNNQDAVFSLGELTASDFIPVVGDSVDLTIPATNNYNEPLDYTLEFYEGPTQFASPTYTVASQGTTEYSVSRSKSSPAQFTYQAQDPSETNISNEITITWLNIDVGPLEVSDQVLKPGETATVSITVTNVTNSQISVTGRIEENGSKILDEDVSIASADSYTFDVDVTEASETKNEYQAFIQGPAGIEAPSQKKTIEWKESGLYVDTGSGLYEFSPTAVGGFSSWYSYGSPKQNQANHGNFRFGSTVVQVLDDGSNIGISITHHDGSDDLGKQWETNTYWLDSHGGYYVKDDPENQEPNYDKSLKAYFGDKMIQAWGGNRTDGAVVDLPNGDEQEFYIRGDSAGIYFWNTGDWADDRIRIVNNL